MRMFDTSLLIEVLVFIDNEGKMMLYGTDSLDVYKATRASCAICRVFVFLVYCIVHK